MLLKKTPFRIIYAVIVISLLSACSTGNKFASSFGKRKYIKGYYLDMPSNTPKVAELPGLKKLKEHAIIGTAGNSPQQTTKTGEANTLLKAPLRIWSKPANSIKVVVKHLIPIENTSSTILHTALSVLGDGGKHISDKDNSSDSGFSTMSLVCFIVAVALLLIAIIGIVALTQAGSLEVLIIFFIGLIIGGILDVVAMILAFIGIVLGEDQKYLGEIVLSINAAILLTIIILYATGHL